MNSPLLMVKSPSGDSGITCTESAKADFVYQAGNLLPVENAWFERVIVTGIKMPA